MRQASQAQAKPAQTPKNPEARERTQEVINKKPQKKKTCQRLIIHHGSSRTAVSFSQRTVSDLLSARIGVRIDRLSKLKTKCLASNQVGNGGVGKKKSVVTVSIMSFCCRCSPTGKAGGLSLDQGSSSSASQKRCCSLRTAGARVSQPSIRASSLSDGAEVGSHLSRAGG